jgi:hypothetical protein
MLLQCECGSVRGLAKQVSPKRDYRLVCMCDDCQAYAHWLDRADQILDRNGGTEALLLTPAQLEITAGAEHIRCVRLTPKGLMRWYAGCCRTPLGNTLASAKVPFASVLHTFMKEAEDGRSREQALGPLHGRIQGRYGKGELPPDAHPRAPLGLIIRAIGHLLAGYVRRAHTPSPLFDGATGKPVVEPTVLDPHEREQLRRCCGPDHVA